VERFTFLNILFCAALAARFDDDDGLKKLRKAAMLERF
jgi:hypothetical protein